VRGVVADAGRIGARGQSVEWRSASSWPPRCVKPGPQTGGLRRIDVRLDRCGGCLLERDLWLRLGSSGRSRSRRRWRSENLDGWWREDGRRPPPPARSGGLQGIRHRSGISEQQSITLGDRVVGSVRRPFTTHLYSTPPIVARKGSLAGRGIRFWCPQSPDAWRFIPRQVPASRRTRLPMAGLPS
jgi:hypothetical protein